jgi:hypothetical protein
MCNLRRFIAIVCLFIQPFFHPAIAQQQNITGKWEGEMSDEFIRINIQQDGNNLCGYTFDVLKNDKSSYCKSYFTGKYDKKNDLFIINGVKFIENSGDHILMTIKLWFPSQSSNKSRLRGSVTAATPSFLSNLLSEGDLFWVRKVADEPVKPGKYLPVCYDPNPPITRKIKENNPQTREQVMDDKKNREVTNVPEKQIQKDTATKRIPVEEKTITDKIKDNATQQKNNQDKALIKEMNSRKNNSVSTLKVNTDQIQIKLYDNGTIDNDSVSVFYNGRILKKHERLSETPVVIDLKLDQGVKQHQLVMFAENLGSLPPNTALIVVTAGRKRYELHSSASLNENAVLNFEYIPD